MKRLTLRKLEWAERFHKTICLSCGYAGEELQGEHPDLYEGYGCPKCESPLVVIVSDAEGF